MERAGSILLPAIKRLGIEEDVRFQRIINDWDKIFSEPLSLHMSPSRLLEGELLLNTDSPIWMHQLQFCRSEIIGKLASFGVRKVRFRVGKVLRPKSDDTQGGNQAPGRLSQEDAGFIDDLVSAVRDETLKSAIRTAAEKSLSSRTRRP